MYTNRQRMNYEPCPCDAETGCPPGWLLDKIAEEKLTGGYDTSPDNLCTVCYTYKSKNGSCNC